MSKKPSHATVPLSHQIPLQLRTLAYVRTDHVGVTTVIYRKLEIKMMTSPDVTDCRYPDRLAVAVVPAAAVAGTGSTLAQSAPAPTAATEPVGRPPVAPGAAAGWEDHRRPVPGAAAGRAARWRAVPLPGGGGRAGRRLVAPADHSLRRRDDPLLGGPARDSKKRLFCIRKQVLHLKKLFVYI